MKRYQPVCDDCGAKGQALVNAGLAVRSARAHRCGETCLNCHWARPCKGNRGLCSPCYWSEARFNYPDGRGWRRADLLEDAEWLLADGANLTQAIARLGIKADSFWQACKRAGRLDLFHRLSDREPDGEFRAAVRAAHKARKAS